MTVEEWMRVQHRLIKLGFNPGPVDGIRGRQTTNAIRVFQNANDLVVDGIVGPNTFRALFGDQPQAVQPISDDMPWFDTAKQLVGTREVGGSANNPAILKWADDIDIDYASDDIPWCGLFVAHCIGSTLGMEPMPTNPLGARNWLKFGRECTPQLGAVLVFWRGKPSGWTGHVGFYAGEDPNFWHVLGGNQSDAVNILKIPRVRLLGARWPVTAGLPAGTVVAGDSNVLVTSGNEA